VNSPITIIDLFAGPGGLGEGFSAYTDASGDHPFKIGLSIEKESSAHKTLKLRAFYRQYPTGEAPDEYYQYLEGNLGKDPEELLYRYPHLRKQAQAASEEARQLTLGEDNGEIEKSIEKSLGKRPGNWVLIGGPPCQAYSLVGRARNAGNEKYTAEGDHRNFLYREYLNIIARFKPSVFVMENVKGMLSAKVGGVRIFDKIREDLHYLGRAIGSNTSKREYEIFSLVVDSGNDLGGRKEPAPKDFIIRAENYGVPQARHRVILLGVRSDIASKMQPDTLTEAIAPSVQQMIADLPRLRSGLSKGEDSMEKWASAIHQNSELPIEAVKKSSLEEVVQIMEKTVQKIGTESLNRGGNWGRKTTKGISANAGVELCDWINDPAGWRGVCNHETRGHIGDDLARYLFCSSFGSVKHPDGRWTPKASDFPSALAPNHKNWSSGKFADRFRVQAADRHATTITSHISKDGHYFIHYDPTQCRSLTVREAARIQTFPDNYFFVGNRTQQYTQVGNAVPPFLAKQIAGIAHDVIKNR
jgi:DNA (cytosine-5)-methyltransferase 1